MMFRALLLAFAALVLPHAARAEDNVAPRGKVWVEAGSARTLAEALRTAERLAPEFEFTRVFLTVAGGHAVTLGVVDQSAAEETIAQLKRQRRIPRETVTTDGRDYLTELWSARRAKAEGDGLLPELRAALALEARERPEDRRAVQEALAWTGDLAGAADGVFGAETRAAMRAFQARLGVPVTGHLDAEARARLSDAAETRRTAIGWRVVRDGPLGLSVGLPAILFPSAETETLGKRLEGAGPAEGALLSLVALDGGRETFEGLFDAARRELARDPARIEQSDAAWFFVSGRAGGRIVHTFATREGDAVRGFILSHDDSQAALLGPVARAMRQTFRHAPVAAAPRIEDELGRTPRTPALPRRPETAPETPEPRVADNAASGRVGERRTPRPRTEEPEPRTRREEPEPRPRTEPRRPPETTERPERPRRRDDRDVASTGSGFYVSLDGKIVTNHHVVEGCRRMIVDGRDEARVLATDEKNDLALLLHRVTRKPEEVASFARAEARLNSDVTVVGFPLYGLLGGLNVTRGVVSSLSGLRGDNTFLQISAEVQPGNSGGPALDERGQVIGVVQSKLNAARIMERSGDIPQNINFAVRAEIAKAFLKREGVTYIEGQDRPALAPADLADEAKRFTVLLECIK